MSVMRVLVVGMVLVRALVDGSTSEDSKTDPKPHVSVDGRGFHGKKAIGEQLFALESAAAKISSAGEAIEKLRRNLLHRVTAVARQLRSVYGSDRNASKGFFIAKPRWRLPRQRKAAVHIHARQPPRYMPDLA